MSGRFIIPHKQKLVDTNMEMLEGYWSAFFRREAPIQASESYMRGYRMGLNKNPLPQYLVNYMMRS